MKKLISIILAVILLVTSFCSVVDSIDRKEINDYPVICVPGYSSSNLYKINDDGTEDKIWGLGIDEILDVVLSKIAQIGIGIGALTVGNSDYLADLVGKEIYNMMSDLRCNNDGTSYYKVRTMFPTAHESNREVMYEEYGNYIDYQFETDIMGLLAEYTESKKIYNFNVDFRMGAIECANQLDNYIQEVKKDSGFDKVNIFAISHGGQITATYLTLYGEKQDVYNALLTVPAIQGSCLLYDILPQSIALDELNLVYFIENGLMAEDDFHWLVEAQELGFLDEVLNKLVPYLMKVAGNWGSVWDFTPLDIYESMKSKWLDSNSNKELIKKSDYMHYTIMPQFYSSLQRCNDEYGMHVSILAGTDINCTSGYPINGDGIIYTKSSTGATCPTYGLRFADGYKQVNECNNKYKVSPAMTVDASTGYLPDNTWYVSGLFHGMMVWDMHLRELMIKLMLTDEIKDVYSDPEYPQFHESSNSSNGVWAKFNNSTEGYLSSKDSTLLVKNTSLDNRKVRLISITCDGADINFNLNSSNKKIEAGQIVEIPFTGIVPSKSNSKISIIFTYYTSGSLTPLGQRIMSFTIQNGDSPQYDINNPIVSAYARLPIDDSIFSIITAFLKNIGLYNLFSIYYNIFNSLKIIK